MPPPQRKFAQNLNLWAGVIIPIIVVGVNAYAMYAVTKEIGVSYLINPPYDFIPTRRATGIAVIVLQYVLFFPIAASWIRFLTTVFANPGYTRLGQRPSRRRSRRMSRSGRRSRPSSRASRSRSQERPATRDEKDELGLDRYAVRDGLERCPPGLDAFYSKEVFVCGPDGIPRFCNTCWNWKSDRTHHCGELGRCIRRFDHYCPWVGGAVSETNNKFFIQFTFYATNYSIFLLVLCIWAIVQSKKDCNNSPRCNGDVLLNGNWIGCLILAIVFGFMASGIVLRFGYFVLVNRTTIEELNKGHPNYSIAVRIVDAEIPRAPPAGGVGPPTFWVVPYPFRPRSGPAADEPRRDKEYLYAILQPRSGINPWDLGYYRNFKSVMGNNVWDWFLPLRYSPCIDHDDPISDYPLGKDFEELEKAFLPHRYDRKGRRLTPLEQ